MSELRDQLDRARQQHHAARYDGDLAAEMLPQPHNPAAWRRGALVRMGFIGGAIAAVVLLALRLSQLSLPMEGAARELVEIPADEPATFALGSFPALSVPAAPEGLWSALEAPAFALSIPSFPQIDDDSSGSSSTTQEAT